MTPAAPFLLAALLLAILPLAQPARAQEGPAVGYGEGFFVRSAGGRAELSLEGLFQIDGRYDADRDPSTTADLRRMRVELAGRFDQRYRFRIEPNFGAEDVELEEAWAGVELGPDAILRIGRMKAPFNLEEVRSLRFIPFPRFSILNQFAPAEQHGLFLNGESGELEYGLAGYTGNGGRDDDDGQEAAARVMVHPFAGHAGSGLAGLAFGLAGTYGRGTRTVGGKSIDNAAGLPLIELTPGVRLDGTRWRAGLEAAWLAGPWMAQAEWMHVRQAMSGGAGRADVDFQGGYLSLQRALTGEDVSYGGVRRDESSGDVAWVLALRASLLESDEALRNAGLVVPGTYTKDVTSVWLGLDTYLGDHALVRTSWVHSFYSSTAPPDEDSVLVQFQLHF